MSFLERIVKAFTSRKIPYALVGGYAVALHGAPRGTVDIDIVVKHSEDFFKSVERCMKDMGFQPRLPVTAEEIFHFKEEYITKRNLIAWSFYNPKNPIEVLDVVITHDLNHMKSVSKKLGLWTVNVLSIEDLIKMKNDAGRPQDFEDVRVLKAIRK
jgi:hypothetical protein